MSASDPKPTFKPEPGSGEWANRAALCVQGRIDCPIRFSEEDIRIEFTGMRPGEKLYEELLADGETTQPTPHPKLRVARADGRPDAAWFDALERWITTDAVPQPDAVKRELAQFVPEYRRTD